MSNADSSANNQEESYHNIPSSKYFWISRKTDHGIAVHYGFFKAWSLFLISFVGLSTAVLCLTNWWQLFAVASTKFLFWDNWYIGFPTVGIISGYFYIKHTRKVNRKLQEQLARQRKRAVEDAQITLSKKR
jgi:hypothetical protein